MRKEEVLKIIDEVMNNREIDSIRNAILAIRDKVIEYDEYFGDRNVKIELTTDNELWCTMPWFPGARYICVDTTEYNDHGERGTYWYE